MIKPLRLWIGLSLFVYPVLSQSAELQIHAKTWADIGRIMHATDTLQINLNGDWQQTMGMQIGAKETFSDHLEGAFGFGINQVYHSLGDPNQEKFTLSKFINYISEARVTYSTGKEINPFFTATIGDFAFNYNPQVKNLGLYLFRGPVYPGFLVSGFKEFHTDTTRASFLGFHLHNSMGNFQHDLILSSERDLPPSFDWSLGYVAKYQIAHTLKLGGGVNFYHLIPQNSAITTPNQDRKSTRLNSSHSEISRMPSSA